MNNKKHKKERKKHNNKIGYILRKREIDDDNTQSLISDISFSFSYNPNPAIIFAQLRKRKINVSFSKLEEKVKELDLNSVESIRNLSQKRKDLEKEITILRRDWNINSIIDEK